MSTSEGTLRRARVSSEFAGKLRKKIVSGEWDGGAYLPTLRQLTKEFGLADKTIQRGLKQLANEGWVRSEPRKGYRVLLNSSMADQMGPIAYIIAEGKHIEGWMVHHRVRLSVIQEVATRRGCPLLTVPTLDRQPAEICDQLVAVGACGVILDTADEPLLERMNSIGLPVVMSDNATPLSNIDEVRGNEYEGAFLAARYLAQRGHRRMAWLGPPDWNSNSLERFGGAVAGACSAGLPPSAIERVKLENETLEGQTHDYLKGSKRPDALLALWRDNALAVGQAAEALGLGLGDDVELVGWCPDEMFDIHYAAICPNLARQSATVTWRLSDGANLALDFLERRRRNPACSQVRERLSKYLREPSPAYTHAEALTAKAVPKLK